MISVLKIDKRNSENGIKLPKDIAFYPNHILLETCFRKEIYHGTGAIPEDVSRHLFRLVSGLDSVFLGESAIQGQVKEAYLKATQTNKLHKNLHKLFQRALYVGRKVRTNTNITRGAVSYAQASVDLIINHIGDNLHNYNITLTGAHRLNENILQYLVKNGANSILVANRTHNKALSLAEKYGCKASRFNELPKILEKTDILISSTAAPHYVVKKDIFPKKKSMIILDLAVPADVDPEIGLFPNINLYHITDIESKINQNIEKRKTSIELAEQIINDEVSRFSADIERHHNYYFQTNNI